MRSVLRAVLWVFLSVLSSPLWGSTVMCDALSSEGLTAAQQAFIRHSYAYGKLQETEYGTLKNSLAAIVWQESSAGVHLVNDSDPSAGAHQILLRNALYYLEWEDTPENREIAKNLLITDSNISANFAVRVLRFWIELHEGDWMRAWASYNAGYQYQNGKDYAKGILRKVSVIRECEWG